MYMPTKRWNSVQYPVILDDIYFIFPSFPPFYLFGDMEKVGTHPK